MSPFFIKLVMPRAGRGEAVYLALVWALTGSAYSHYITLQLPSSSRLGSREGESRRTKTERRRVVRLTERTEMKQRAKIIIEETWMWVKSPSFFFFFFKLNSRLRSFFGELQLSRWTLLPHPPPRTSPWLLGPRTRLWKLAIAPASLHTSSEIRSQSSVLVWKWMEAE